jgi:hypothetical protein
MEETLNKIKKEALENGYCFECWLDVVNKQKHENYIKSQ